MHWQPGREQRGDQCAEQDSQNQATMFHIYTYIACFGYILQTIFRQELFQNP